MGKPLLVCAYCLHLRAASIRRILTLWVRMLSKQSVLAAWKQKSLVATVKGEQFLFQQFAMSCTVPPSGFDFSCKAGF